MQIVSIAIPFIRRLHQETRPFTDYMEKEKKNLYVEYK